MSLPKYFISCDWGTTNFRLKVVQSDTLALVAEIRTTQGIKTLYTQFQQQNTSSQFTFFSNYLTTQIKQLPEAFHSCPIVCSGMTSSTIGMQELAYGEFPIQQDGSSLLWKQIPLDTASYLLLISGVKSATGMMRGEEVQAIGIADALTDYDTGTLLLPGTHSKHIHYENGQYRSLTNFMTGELFEVLSKKSILANSVAPTALTTATTTAFKKGLALGFDGQLSASLLLVRANDVIHHTAPSNNYYFLSGLLIGDELAHLKGKQEKIFLAAPRPIFDLYSLALSTLFEAKQLVLFDGDATDKALLIGQRKILELHCKVE